MNALDPLTYEYRAGSGDGPVLLLLHGTGGGPRDLVGLADFLAPGATILAPQGPVSEGGYARWFRRLAEGVFDTEDVRRRANQLAGFILAAGPEHGLDERPLVAVGFSNGANIAAATLLLRPDALRQAILFATMAALPDPPALDLSRSRVFLSNGERDPMAPRPAADRLVDDLRTRGVDVTVEWHGGGHQVTVEGPEAARRWLETLPAAG
ncbi:MAG: alpha/beta hydrolase [Candidatus Dormiibacterota bacterium]